MHLMRRDAYSVFELAQANVYSITSTFVSGTAAGYTGSERATADLSALCGGKNAVRGGKNHGYHAGTDFQKGEKTACEIARESIIFCYSMQLVIKNIQ